MAKSIMVMQLIVVADQVPDPGFDKMLDGLREIKDFAEKRGRVTRFNIQIADASEAADKGKVN